MHILTWKQIKAKQTNERLMLDVFQKDMRRQFPGKSEPLLSIIMLILIEQNDICVTLTVFLELNSSKLLCLLCQKTHYIIAYRLIGITDSQRHSSLN